MIRLSAIVLIPDGRHISPPLLESLRAQTLRDAMELVVVSAEAPEPGQLNGFADWQWVQEKPLLSTARARAAGIAAARGEWVVLTEDHCFPAPTWAERLLTHPEASAVGVRFMNANSSSPISWANLIIEYGEFLQGSSGPRPYLPGHNGAYRTALLRDIHPLERWLETEWVLQQRLVQQGHSLYWDADATTLHQNFEFLWPSLALRFWGGRLFAARRSSDWNLLKRVVYALAWPLIALRRFRRTGGQGPRRASPFVLFLLGWDAVGEAAGYLTGAGRAMEILSDWEFRRYRFMRPQGGRGQAATPYPISAAGERPASPAPPSRSSKD